uniref:UBP1-associated protein 2C-like n=1 Tax=Elaeis guineensis var. tenera TaxID=51953 RepID=A0A6I9QYW9_ELAGV|nr:UBP1-associated protein 2C-like [Elaeis guineensis]
MGRGHGGEGMGVGGIGAGEGRGFSGRVESGTVRTPVRQGWKLFVRGLGCETSFDRLRSIFASYGDLEEAIVTQDRATGQSRGYGFITNRHIDKAFQEDRRPDDRHPDRHCQVRRHHRPSRDISLRKIYISGVPAEMPADRFLAHFSSHGDIQEGAIGFEKQMRKSMGFALFVYKTAKRRPWPHLSIPSRQSTDIRWYVLGWVLIT